MKPTVMTYHYWKLHLRQTNHPTKTFPLQIFIKDIFISKSLHQAILSTPEIMSNLRQSLAHLRECQQNHINLWEYHMYRLADFDEELLNKLKSKKLGELYLDLLAWEPHPELASYHISFLKNYLALLVHFQQHRTSRVSEKINKSLFNQIRNQKPYLKWYKLGVSEEKKGKFHIDDRYVRYLRKLGVQLLLTLIS